MHICIASLPLRSGGAERLVLEEASYFSEQGHEITILTREYADSFVEEVGLPADVAIRTYGDEGTGQGALGFVDETRAVRGALSDLDPDLLFTHYKSINVYLAQRLSELSIPYTAHVHGSIFWFRDNPRLLPHTEDPGFEELLSTVPGHREFQGDAADGPVVRAKARVEEFLQERALRDCDVVFTGSRQVADELDVLYGVDATVARPGVDADWLDARGETEPVDLRPETHAVLAVSRLDPRKRFDLLIRAVARLRERGIDVGLVIGGTGPHEERLWEVAIEEGIDDHVTFAGYVPEADLPSYYAAADAFACPAWMSYGLAPLEAYGMGTKLALSTDTYVKEVLGEEPGVGVAEPTVGAWADVLGALLGGGTPGTGGASTADTDAARAEVADADTAAAVPSGGAASGGTAVDAAPTNPGAVPTWAGFCREKERRLEAEGLL